MRGIGGPIARVLSAIGGSGPLRASLASIYMVMLGTVSQRFHAWPLAILEYGLAGLTSGLVIGATRRRGFWTRVWEPTERSVLLSFCAVMILHGAILLSLPTFLLGAVLGATRMRRAMVAADARRRLARHSGDVIADVAVQEAVDRHVHAPDPFGSAWHDMSREIEKLRSSRDVVALSLAEDHEIAADQLLAARAEGAAVMPPRIFQK